MSVGTVLSRITGLIRLAAIAAALGIVETRITDTYNLANTAPNIIYELVLGGILTSVFVPVFVELLEKEGRERAWEVASAIINLSLVILVATTTLVILAAPWIAKIYAMRLEGAGAERQEEVLTFLLRLCIPQIIFYGLAAITAGLLNAHKRFAAPMYTPILNNLAVIIVFVAFYKAYGAVDTITTKQQLIIGLGTTGGIALMALAQLPFLRGLGRYRMTFSARHPSVKKLARLSVFVAGYVIANQIGYFIIQWLANKEQGGYSAYLGAYIFYMLPHGLFAVSVITALLPGMSAHAVNQRWADFRERLSIGVRSTFFLLLPAAVGYFLLAEPIVRLLLERGVAGPRSTEQVSDVLRLFVLGLVPFAVFQLYLRAFYALQDTKTPFLINCGAVVINTAVNIPLFGLLGVEGLAAGHAIAYIFGMSVQARYLSRRIGGLDGRAVAASTARIAAASAGMGVIVWGLWRILDGIIDSAGLVSEATLVVVPVAAGVASYLAFAHMLGVQELDYVRGLLRSRTRD
jgi:putative peptidoglycan lipid II flippase